MSQELLHIWVTLLQCSSEQCLLSSSKHLCTSRFCTPHLPKLLCQRCDKLEKESLITLSCSSTQSWVTWAEVKGEKDSVLHGDVILLQKSSLAPLSFPGRDLLRDIQQVAGMCGSSSFPKYPQSEAFALGLPWHLTCQYACISKDFSDSLQEGRISPPHRENLGNRPHINKWLTPVAESDRSK